MKLLYFQLLDIKQLVRKPSLYEVRDKFDFDILWETYGTIDSDIQTILNERFRLIISHNIIETIVR